MDFLCFAICFGATVLGAICGNGGGVIIKPVLDALRVDTVSTASFLSSCTVLAMTCYSVGRSLLSREHRIQMATCLPLSLGAVAGGIAGKQAFSALKASAGDDRMVLLAQAVLLGLTTVISLWYLLRRDRLPVHQVKSKAACLGIGLILGMISSFLGIGGGILNIVVLLFFFGMETKTAAANSLFIVLFCQASGLVTLAVTGAVPPFRPLTLILMGTGGILGGIAGRRINRHLSNRAVDRLILGMTLGILLVCVYNTWSALAG